MLLYFGWCIVVVLLVYDDLRVFLILFMGFDSVCLYLVIIVFIVWFECLLYGCCYLFGCLHVCCCLF